MSAEDPLLGLACDICEGHAVDWDALESLAEQADRKVLRNLRALAVLADAHRTLQSESPADRVPPTSVRWGHLEIRGVLGHGAAGDVYLAWDSRLETEVALKLLRPGASASATGAIDEARRMARVRHPHVVSVLGADVHDGRVGIWMERVRGRSLGAVLAAQGALGWREAAIVGIDVCGALAAVHQAGLLHRDVKSQNVFRENGGRTVLMDFSAGVETGGAPDAPATGTPLYLAPEIFAGEPASEKSDIYSLGVLLFHLVTSDFPVRARSLGELREAHAHREGRLLLDSRSGLPDAFSMVVERALDPDPRGRHASVGEFQRALAGALGISLAPPPRPSGMYRLLRKLGEGAVGEVWLAEQTEPVRRQVAMKIVKPGMDSRQVIARFEAERQALALMDHPTIAKIFDAGETPQARPYFAMEYVQGEPINEFCDRHRLSIPERLELFLKVCDGVQHAHQKGVIHRDLKPSNVLVSAVSRETPVPKIIDFGVAKAIAMPLTERTLLTEAGVLIGTPEYMSPEQVEMGAMDVDTRADVYALGVILYELLAGVLPFEPEQFRSAGFDEIRRLIREVDPPRPSARVATLGDRAISVAVDRGSSPTKLANQIRGDLDWIVMKALEKDRTRRFDSPSGLSGDLQRYLENQPVLAGPPSARYRAAKFMRRHRAAVVVTVSGVVLLASAAIASAGFAVRLARERDRANREAETARQVSQFLTDVFKVADPSEDRGNSIKVREILDRGTERIRKNLGDQSLVQGRLLVTMGDTYDNLGLTREAAGLYEAGVKELRATLGPHDSETLHAVDSLASNYSDQGRLTEAEKLAAEALEQARQAFGENGPPTIKAKTALASVYSAQSRFSEAEELYRQAANAQASLSGPDDPNSLVLHHDLAKVLLDEGRWSEAEGICRETLERRSRVLGRDHPLTLTTATLLAVVYKKERKFDDAERLYRETLEMGRRVLGSDHPNVMNITNNLGTLYLEQRRFREAETWLQETLSRRLRVLGPENPRTLTTRTNFASALVGDGRAAEAEPLLRQNLDILRRVLGVDHANTLMCLDILGSALLQQHRFPEAEDCTRTALEARRRTLGETHPETLESVTSLADVLSSERRHDEAIRLYREAYDAWSRTRGATDAYSLDALVALAKAQARGGHPGDAVTSLRKALEAGYADANGTLDSPDFSPLRPDTEFQQLVALAHQRARHQTGENAHDVQRK